MKKFNLILRLIIGGWFLYFGLAKIVTTKPVGPWQMPVLGAVGPVHIPQMELESPALFAKSIQNFRMVPRETTNVMAMTMSWIEVVAGLMLMVGLWKRPSALVIAFLLAIFLVAIGQAVYRDLNINCGCAGTTDGRKVGAVALIEDGLGFLAALWLAFWYKD